MAAEKFFQVGPVRVRVSTTADAPRERLSRERIVDVALAQMKERGYDAVSMRSIAKELDTGPASLYAHVAHKDELDQLVIDRIATLVEVPEPDPERWAEQVKDVMRANLAAYRAHPGSAQAALAMIPTAEGGLRAAEGFMQLLLAGGIPPQAAAWFCDLAALYVSAIAAEESIWAQRGKAAAAGGRPVSEEDVVAQVRQVFAALPPETYPALTRHATEMTTGDGDDRFEFGLDVLLAGLVAVSRRA
ncbi:transcriptional regulator, TetR family [Nocardioides terrae]|uniref:Transcriptional regulator, TetR family n=1 Tax=Nocardioides terrae TaxID=574651 RepID=A0A1I1JBH8_9ACTN|nr:TetR/AcrR family transcriptional regulator [Nocardioides terrae]SFC42790.1 transcriptional regulator, TetR family [Nocardioides terrae]